MEDGNASAESKAKKFLLIPDRNCSWHHHWQARPQPAPACLRAHFRARVRRTSHHHTNDPEIQCMSKARQRI